MGNNYRRNKLNKLATINQALVTAAGGEGEIDKARREDFEALMHRIAMDVGKQVVDHIEHAYPAICDAVAWDSARMSVRNSTYNSIMEAVRASGKGELEAMLERHDGHRRLMRKLRKAAGQRY